MQEILHPVEIPPKKTTMTMDNAPFEDVFSSENGCHVSFSGVYMQLYQKMNLSFTSAGLEGLFASTKLAVFLEQKTCISSVDAFWFNCLRIVGT